MKPLARRGFLFGAGATLVSAPAIVKACNLMPVRGIVMDAGWVRIHPAIINRMVREDLQWALPPYYPGKYSKMIDDILNQ